MIWLVATAALAADATRPGVAAPHPSRIVSLNPSLTAVLVALGAGETLVGVDEFSARQQPGLRGLPRVGGLYDPSLEAVVALRPDLVVLVPSVQQRDFRARLAELGIDVLALDPVTFDEVLAMIETLGARVGRDEAAQSRVAAIRSAKAEVERASGGRSRPRTVLVLQREPLFVVGAGSFIDDMLRAAGADNLGAQLGQPYPRASLEWLVAAQPEVILDSSSEPGDAKLFWSRWPSLPAVSSDRVVTVDADVVTLPGPALDRALRALGAAIATRAGPTRAPGPTRAGPTRAPMPRAEELLPAAAP
jgi:iron complex transport system substrate-binding protein